MPSASASTIPAGAVPARIASARTLLLELEPRPEGMTRIRPVSEAPACGCRRSMTVPVSGSKPPQKLRGSSRITALPEAVPPSKVRPSKVTPEPIVPPDPALNCGLHALFGAPEHHLDADVCRRVIRPLRGVRHHCARLRTQDRSDVRAGIDHDLHAGIREP